MEIKESIEVIYTWEDDKGTKSTTSFKQSWDGLTKEAPSSPYLHDQFAALLTAVGLDKPSLSNQGAKPQKETND